VKSVGWLNLKGSFETARWPFNRKIDNVGLAPTISRSMGLSGPRRRLSTGCA
jgi:hypothetical protein